LGAFLARKEIDMSEPCLGGCEDLAKRLGFDAAKECCGSHHQDAEDGYVDLWKYNMDDGYYTICCGIACKLDDLQESI
jgi:hypothetical protein